MRLTKNNKAYSVKLLKLARIHISLFMAGLVISGLTAFPIETQLTMVINHISWLPQILCDWMASVHKAIIYVNIHYPYLSYGTDWLGFAHLVIAINFIGAYRDPIKNIWVMQFGIIACSLIFPFALIAGEIREIPLFWRLIDCSFGLFGGLLLCNGYRLILRLQSMGGCHS